MRVLALISGGKDSCYNMMQCVAAGHEIVALANLQPQGKDELDSFMFQTVGHEGVALYAEALCLPLYRGVTRGLSSVREKEYAPHPGDEVEDLYTLLARVKEEVAAEGVSSGAILSDYQRLRVENVCARLGLVSLAYLWQRDQAQLLKEMIEAGVVAVVIKVATMGLYPEKHLGKTLEELYPHLIELHSQYGSNVCGEGGEYETFTLDCPLFHKKIVLDDTEVCSHSDDAFAPVSYLRLSRLHLEEKPTTALTEHVLPPKLLGSEVGPLLMVTGLSQCECRGDYVWLVKDGKSVEGGGGSEEGGGGGGDGDGADVKAEEQTRSVFNELRASLHDVGCSWKDAVLVYLYLADMSHYARVNKVYCSYFPSRPPARVCVEMVMGEGVLVRVEAVVWRGEDALRSSLHVQSVSHWAPANIGPYSQAYSVGDVVFLAGQIGLVPGSMQLFRRENSVSCSIHTEWNRHETQAGQAQLALTHSQSVLLVCHAHLTSALCGVCYVANDQAAIHAKEAWKRWLDSHQMESGCPVVFLPAPSLPRGACVEWHFIAVKSRLAVKYASTIAVEKGVGVVSVEEAWCSVLEVGCWAATVVPLLPSHSCDWVDALKSALCHLHSALCTLHLSSQQLTLLRVSVPRQGSIRGAEREEEASGACRTAAEAAGLGGSPLSVLLLEGHYGQGCPLTVHALKLQPVTATSEELS